MTKELDEIVKKECQFTFDHFDFKMAREIADEIIYEARKNNQQICMEIFCFNKILVQYSMDGCTPDNNNWLFRKRNAVLHFHHSTYYLWVKNKKDASNLVTKYGLKLSDYCIVPGGFPIIMKNGSLIGSISVSGLADAKDHELIINVLHKRF